MINLTFKSKPTLSLDIGAVPSMSMAVNGQATVVQVKAVTPTDTEQVIEPDAGYLLSKVTVARIPDNYGRIAYNGGILTVY